MTHTIEKSIIAQEKDLILEWEKYRGECGSWYKSIWKSWEEIIEEFLIEKQSKVFRESADI